MSNLAFQPTIFASLLGSARLDSRSEGRKKRGFWVTYFFQSRSREAKIASRKASRVWLFPVAIM